MGIAKFIFSKVFLKQLAIALGVLVVLTIILMQVLKYSTNHGEYVIVPDLSKKTLNEVEGILNETNLNFVVQDSTEFNPKYPRFSVIGQNPLPGNKVKENRKIYLTINPSGYRKVSVPKVIQLTKRNAEAIIKAVGLEVGEITYENHIGKDMVLKMTHKGQPVKPGDMLVKTSKIDLVCGNGEGSGIDDEPADSTGTAQAAIDF